MIIVFVNKMGVVFKKTEVPSLLTKTCLIRKSKSLLLNVCAKKGKCCSFFS